MKGRPVNYRHVIGSFAQARSLRPLPAVSRCFPPRLAYDALKRWRGERADVEYPLTTMESTVSALALLREPFDYAIKELANPARRAPVLTLSGMPDLRVYDSLLAGVA